MENNPLIQIDIWMDNEFQTTIVIGQMCTLHQLRQDLIAEDEVDLPESFQFMIDGNKVRNELSFKHTFKFFEFF